MRRTIAAATVLLLLLSASSVVMADSDSDEEDQVLVHYQNALQARRAVRNLGGTVEDEFPFISVLAASIPVESRGDLQDRPHVNFVETDHKISAQTEITDAHGHVDLDDPGELWGILRVLGGETDVWKYVMGEGVSVAILDTGVYGHADLSLQDGFDAVNNGDTDEYGQGTAVAGVIAGDGDEFDPPSIAPLADLYDVRVMDADGEGRLAHALAGLEWAVRENVRVIHMGFELTGESEALELACEAAYDAGAFLVAGAGDRGENDGDVIYPAGLDWVTAVSASDEDNDIAEWSCTGQVDWIAPGVGITSTAADDDDGYWTLDGTALASAHAAGAVALLCSADFDLSNKDLWDVLAEKAEDLGLKDKEQGAGLIRVNEAVYEVVGETGTVEGRVSCDEDDEPIEDAGVRVAGTGISGTTDDEGEFLLEEVPVGEGTLVVTAEGYREKEVAFELEEEDEEIDVGDIYLDLRPEYDIGGYVYDRESEDGIEGATIRVRGTDIDAETEEDGYFEMTVPEGTWDLRASADGYESKTREVEVKEEDLAIVEFELRDKDEPEEVESEAAGRLLQRHVNLRARWVQAHVYPPRGSDYRVGDISDVKLEGVSASRLQPTGHRMLAFFDVVDLLDELEEGEEIEVTLTVVVDDTHYIVDDTVRVSAPGPHFGPDDDDGPGPPPHAGGR